VRGAARAVVGDGLARSTSVWYSSHWSSLKCPHPARVGCVVTAFQPSCQIDREPSRHRTGFSSPTARTGRRCCLAC
jgi:hypothetical protein